MILQRQDVYMLLSILVNIENRGSFFFFYKMYFEGTSRFKMKNSFTACSSVDNLKNVIYSSKCVPHKAKPFASLDFIFI